ncbi:MAG: hypothetical protein Kow0079_13310 [Vicingaceae bacterium]
MLDASQSMLGQWNGTKKITVATKLLSQLMDSIAPIPNLEVGLRVYGHQDPVKNGDRNCKDTKLEVPFKANNHIEIKNKLKTIYPRGTTPIAYSLEQAAYDFPDCKKCRNLIILITDGIEECDGDPCAISKALQSKGIVLKPFVIGMGLKLDIIDAFKCVGNFYNTDSEESFQNVLGVVISQALNNTTVQVNLLDKSGEPTETDVNMTFYNHNTGKIEYNFIHTINHKGVPDTLPLDPALIYDLQVHTLPQVSKENIKINPGQHNIIAVDAPQGNLKLKVNGYNEYTNLKAIVRQSGKMNTLNIQDFDQEVKYIVGNYDIEILTLPRTYINNVNIAQSHTTKVEIPQPGLLALNLNGKGIAQIFNYVDGKLELIYTVPNNVDRLTLPMQPGKYKIVYRPMYSKKAIYTEEKNFSITSGLSTQVNF